MVVSLSGPFELLSAQFLSFVFDVTSRVRRLSRDRRCENNHRHHIDSCRGATVSTFARRVTTPWRSQVKMTRRTARGARSTGTDLQQEQAGEQKWSAQAPTSADLMETQECSTFSSDADAAHEYSLWRTSGEQCARPFVGLVERGTTTVVVASSTMGQC